MPKPTHTIPCRILLNHYAPQSGRNPDGTGLWLATDFRPIETFRIDGIARNSLQYAADRMGDVPFLLFWEQRAKENADIILCTRSEELIEHLARKYSLVRGNHGDFQVVHFTALNSTLQNWLLPSNIGLKPGVSLDTALSPSENQNTFSPSGD